jgi:hypothetical protein
MASTMPTTMNTALSAPVCTADCQNRTAMTATRTRSMRRNTTPRMYQAGCSCIGTAGE